MIGAWIKFYYTYDKLNSVGLPSELELVYAREHKISFVIL